jgi:hypothetical protein
MKKSFLGLTLKFWMQEESMLERTNNGLTASGLSSEFVPRVVQIVLTKKQTVWQWTRHSFPART